MDKLNLIAALPEIALLVAASFVLIADAVLPPERRMSVERLALGALLFPLIATLWQLGSGPQAAFGRMYLADSMAHLLKLVAYLSMALTIIYARRYAADRELAKGEFYVLALFSLLGQMVMISAGNLLVVYLGLELMSLSLYALTALRRDHSMSTEAAMKYFVLGALASGFLLYGMSMVYGGVGTLDLADIARKYAAGQVNSTVLVFGVVFIVAGLAFKFGAVPFHMWLPDVYQGAPTAASLLIAAGPKLAAFAIAFRLLADGMLGVAQHWQQMLIVLAVLSLVLGNLIAIAQTNLKRMLAYSTISQIGFVLLGMASGVVGGKTDATPDAFGSSMFYVITYVLTTLGTFGLIQLLARRGFESDEIADLRGLNRRSPWLAFTMLVMMFSLAGIPPFVGFYGKLFVLQAVLHAGHLWLAVLAVLFSLVGAFYYLRVVKVMYFDEPLDHSAIPVELDARLAMGVNGLIVLMLGIVPGWLLTACVEAIRQVLAA